MIPGATVNYNHFAHGVYRADQLMSYYKYNHKTVKMWKRIFFFFLECSVLNSFVLSQKNYNNYLKIYFLFLHRYSLHDMIHILLNNNLDLGI